MIFLFAKIEKQFVSDREAFQILVFRTRVFNID